MSIQLTECQTYINEVLPNVIIDKYKFERMGDIIPCRSYAKSSPPSRDCELLLCSISMLSDNDHMLYLYNYKHLFIYKICEYAIKHKKHPLKMFLTTMDKFFETEYLQILENTVGNQYILHSGVFNGSTNILKHKIATYTSLL